MSGRRIVLAIIVATLTISGSLIVWSNTVLGRELSPQQGVRFVLTVGLCVFLYRGANWARLVAVILYVNLLPERPADEVISYHFRTIRAALEERHGPAKVIPLRRAGPDRSEQTAMVYWVNPRQVTMLSMGLLSDGLPESVPALGVSVADPNRDRPSAQLLDLHSDSGSD